MSAQPRRSQPAPGRAAALVLSTALLAMAARPAPAAASTADDRPGRATEIEVTVDATGIAPAGGPLPETGDFEAFLAGRPVAVTGVAGVDRAWRVLVYVDPALLTPSGLQDAAAALARRSELLADLGAVEVVLADPTPVQLLAPSRDAAAVRAAFESLAGEGGSAGELIELRYELLEAADAGGVTGVAASLATRLLAAEEKLLARARQGLLERSVQGERTGPQLLILPSDGFDRDPGAFYRARTAGADGLEASRSAGGLAVAGAAVPDWEELSRSLAAGGWTALPLAFGDPGPALADPGEPLAALAAASGGRVVRDDRELLSALEAIAARVRLTLRVDADPSGQPLRLEIVGRRASAPVASARWAAATTPLAFSAARAHLAASGGLVAGDAPALAAAVREDGSAEEPHLALTAIAAVPPTPLDGAPALFRLTAFYDLLDADSQVRHDLFTAPPGADTLSFEQTVAGSDLRAAGVVLEALTGGGSWIATRAAVDQEVASLAGAVPAIPWTAADRQPPASTATAQAADGGQLGAVAEPPRGPSTAPIGPGTGTAQASRSPGPISDRIIVLLPPRRAGLGRLGGTASGGVSANPTGRVRLETLVTRPDVARVVFFVDGAEAASDDREPFTATIDLGSEARPRRLRADALSASGRLLGSSEIELAASPVPFRVTITAIDGDPADGEVSVAADVSVPADRELARVEWYFNDTLASQRPAGGSSAAEGGPFRATVATPNAGPNDFLRVVAHLDDGSSIEDARLLSARGEVERVAVNLVELFAVVTDRAGTPLTGLGAEDFTVRLDGTVLPVDRFRLAEEVPLLLGLLVDTSESMWPLLPDTKRAAAKFLSDTLHDGDRAFLVSFDDQPRLVRPPSPDLLELLNGFGALRATGRTALYDAIIFSLLQMEEDRGRRALVLLTDGRDWGSQYGPRRATEYGQRLGVPVYILVFGDLYGDRRPLPQPDLDAVTARTGGQVFYIDRLEELSAVYARIADELRSQYVLAVATGRPLSSAELSGLEVDAGRGRKVRAAVGGSDLD